MTSTACGRSNRVPGEWIHGPYLAAVAIVVAIILYGSLYPFVFRHSVHGVGPMRTLFQTWTQTPRRGDFVANILFYVPFGLFASLARRMRALPAVWIATVCGALLSISMEFAQYYVAGRVTSATDVYANIIGTALGALVGIVAGRNTSWPFFRVIAANRVPGLLVGLWLGYRLFPYVPTIDLHKYWEALKPVALDPSLTGYDLFRHTAICLTIAALVEAIGGTKRAWLLFPLLTGSVLATQNPDRR